jgi:hypothetical protein
MYNLLSRLVAGVHLLYVLFVFLGLFMIYIGYFLKLKMIRNIPLRIIHMIAMIIVAVQQYFMINCPLTILEKKLLLLAGKEIYSGAFIPHLLSFASLNIKTEYYLPLYVSLSILFVLSFVLIPPKRKIHHI